MKSPLISIMCVLVAVCLTAPTALAKKTPDEKKPAIIELQNRPARLFGTEPPGMTAAAAETTVLGWWQFDDTYTGVCDPQGWTSTDLTEQLTTYFHIDGNAAAPGCNAITPISGEKSMWCGQWPSAADPWCGWATLPGYGTDWRQSLVSDTLVCDTLTWTWTAVWDTEPGYDYGYAEYWDASTSRWSRLPIVSGYGKYEGTGGPTVDSHEIVPPNGWTILRYRFASDGAWDDEDGLWPTNEGALKVDDITVACLDGPTYTHDFEGDVCGSTQTLDGFWTGAVQEPYGNYAQLVHGSSVIQEDPCRRVLSCMWAFFDDPEVTNYACGGWPLQGALPWIKYIGDECTPIRNDVRSPWIANTGSGSEYRLSFLTYRDLPLDNLQFYVWHVRTKNASGCPSFWKNDNYIYYGGQKDWLRQDLSIGSFIPADATEIQVAVGVWDGECQWSWPGTYCHSHAPLLDQVRLVRVAVDGPQWAVRHIDLWQDNFPEEGGVDPVSSYARCDMAQDILLSYNGDILPGDSLVVGVSDPNGFADDNTGGRPGKAVYVFVRVTDRYENLKTGKSGAAIQSPDDQAYSGDPNAGLLRWPYAGNITAGGGVWGMYRMDHVYASNGEPVADNYCCDLMDLGSGPTGPHYNHTNENTAANTGIFTPGDVINYFFGARNTLGQWSFWHRTYHGQGLDNQTSSIDAAATDPCEWSVLPDAGLGPGDDGDILFVDEADDRVIVDDIKLRGDPVQAYFDITFSYLGITDRTDRFDILGPSSTAGNSLASRVKSAAGQLVGTPTEIYQQLIWNSSDLSRGLIGDGGPPNSGSGAKKSDDFALFEYFLDNHPNNPGIYAAGDDIAERWNELIGASAVNVRATYMDFLLTGGDHENHGQPLSPLLQPEVPGSYGIFDWYDPYDFYAYGGCPTINDFDVLGAGSNSRVELAYPNGFPVDGAVLAQETANSAGTTARFVLGGFGYDFIRDDEANGWGLVRLRFLEDILRWFYNNLPAVVGIEPEAFENRLGHAHPNPFNPSTTINYSIAERSHVTLKVYNVAGQVIKTLVNEVRSPRAEGLTVTWDGTSDAGREVASGVYFYKLTTKGFSITRKAVLLK